MVVRVVNSATIVFEFEKKFTHLMQLWHLQRRFSSSYASQESSSRSVPCLKPGKTYILYSECCLGLDDFQNRCLPVSNPSGKNGTHEQDV